MGIFRFDQKVAHYEMPVSSQVYYGVHHGSGVYQVTLVRVINFGVDDRKCDTHRIK
jgi:hypothetical protein